MTSAPCSRPRWLQKAAFLAMSSRVCSGTAGGGVTSRTSSDVCFRNSLRRNRTSSLLTSIRSESLTRKLATRIVLTPSSLSLGGSGSETGSSSTSRPFFFPSLAGGRGRGPAGLLGRLPPEQGRLGGVAGDPGIVAGDRHRPGEPLARRVV